jgi:SAM-dependent methyltransferase
MTTNGKLADTREFLDVRRRPGTLDLYVHRKRILEGLRSVAHHLTGTLLDVGCGIQPYRGVFTEPPSRVTRYIGVDLPAQYLRTADVCWDGRTLPFTDAAVDCACATEVLEHCPYPHLVLDEIARVLKPAGVFVLTVPFLWPLHCVPEDEYRFTPYALARLLEESGFAEVELSPLGGWDAAFAQFLGLWVRRRLKGNRLALVARAVLSGVLAPVVWGLERWDRRAADPIHEGGMVTGLLGKARRTGVGRE